MARHDNRVAPFGCHRRSCRACHLLRCSRGGPPLPRPADGVVVINAAPPYRLRVGFELTRGRRENELKTLTLPHNHLYDRLMLSTAVVVRQQDSDRLQADGLPRVSGRIGRGKPG